jgi:hypothetical protein
VAYYKKQNGAADNMKSADVATAPAGSVHSFVAAALFVQSEHLGRDVDIHLNKKKGGSLNRLNSSIFL